MKKLVLLVVFVLGLSSTVYADNYTIRTSDGTSCNQNEESGESVSMGTQFNPQLNTSQFQVSYTKKLGGSTGKKINCGRLYHISLEREKLKLEKARLEVELMRVQIRNARNNKDDESLTDVGDDW